MIPMRDLKELIRDVPDFPKPGIIFKDVTPLFLDAEALKETAARLAAHYSDREVDAVMGVEARGFVIGTAVALEMNKGFILVRKQGKLPYTTESATYELEYGTDTVEVHNDSVKPGQNILVIDDLLATGGTVSACCRLVEKLGGKVAGCGFIIELSFLNGRDKLKPYDIFALIDYPD